MKLPLLQYIRPAAPRACTIARLVEKAAADSYTIMNEISGDENQKPIVNFVRIF